MARNGALKSPLRKELIVTRLFPMRIRRREVEIRLLIEGNRMHARRADSALLKADLAERIELPLLWTAQEQAVGIA